jgi:DNA mismatch repair protein MutS2
VDTRPLELLELPAVLDRLAAQTTFAAGRDAALALRPSPDPGEVARRRAVAEEALILDFAGVPGAGGAHDVRAAGEAAALGARLDVAALGEVRATAGVACEVRGAVLARSDEAPHLAAEAGRIDEGAMRRLDDALGRALDGRGGLRDDASPGLMRARRDLAQARSRAQELVRELARSLRTHLQEGFVTERAGRPVLAVKASSRSAVPGIVHDSSGSGQTLFVEPIALVEANNHVREAAARERDEQELVLAALSALVGERAGPLEAAVEALAAIDLALAGAALSRRWDGCAVAEAPEPVLTEARHPLLDPARAVPVDLDLTGIRALVVSGPNTGGKTVGLKTLGLFALMHQCGLRPPAKGVRLPVFRDVLADIGDEQSIAESLSTFSAHVRRLVGILARAEPGVLVLLDEAAAGTDPEEGAALAQSVLAALVERGARVLCTTHAPELKGWAERTEGAANAAVGLDPRTLAPTYHVRIGEPGGSHALGIAERLGMPAAVVEAARASLGPERRAVEGLLGAAEQARARAADELEAARAEAAGARAERARVEQERAELERRLERMRAQADAERARARQEAERELGDLRRDLAALRAEIAAGRRLELQRRRSGPEPADRRARERDRRLGAAAATAREAEQHLERLVAPPAPSRPVGVGDHVVDSRLGVRGRVVAIEGDQAELQGPLGRVRVPLERLVPDRAHRPAAAPPPPPVEARPAVQAMGPEIDVRGRRAEEARRAVREHVDQAALVGLPRLRVVHGRGTGALRAAIREELARHPLVATAETAGLDEGGDGATIVTL